MTKKTRGRPTQISDQKLKEIALDTKNKLRGQKLTFLLLEKETGIGRQTWKRRLSSFIDELNSPFIPQEKVGDIFFPNIEEMFERHKNNKTKIINELYEYEEIFNSMYRELTLLKQDFKKVEHLQKEYENQKEKLATIKTKADHYESMYKALVATSAFPHLRDDMDIKNNIIDFSKNIENNTSLKETDFEKRFSEEGKLQEQSNISNENKLKSMFPDLFNNE